MADEVSPAYLREGVEFSLKLRGYDPEQVDDFLDRVADNLEHLQHQVRTLSERAVRAEGSAAEHAETETALRRTLVLAQRTADEAVKEAEERAAAIVADAEHRGRAIVAAAEREAARVARAAQQSLRGDLATLERARDALEADVAALRDFLDGERERLHRVADEHLQATEGPEVGRPEIPPEPVVVEAEAEAEEDDEAAAEAQPQPERAADVLDLEAEEHDPFMHELRKASGDDTPLGPRDDDPFAGFVHLDGEHDLGLDRSRWGRRRRR